MDRIGKKKIELLRDQFVGDVQSPNITNAIKYPREIIRVVLISGHVVSLMQCTECTVDEVEDVWLVRFIVREHERTSADIHINIHLTSHIFITNYSHLTIPVSGRCIQFTRSTSTPQLKLRNVSLSLKSSENIIEAFP
jgi:hypothetical protein